MAAAPLGLPCLRKPAHIAASLLRCPVPVPALSPDPPSWRLRNYALCRCDRRPEGQKQLRGVKMAGVPRPSPCFLDGMEPCGAPDGRKRWRNSRHNRYYEWDDVHGHIEAYNKRGRHIAVLHAVTGEVIGSAVPGRRINV